MKNIFYKIACMVVFSITTVFSQGSESSLDFDGAVNYVDLGSTGIALGANFTLETWIYPVDQGNSSWNGFIGNQAGATSNRAPGMWVLNNTRVHFGFGNGSSWQSGNTDSNTLTLDQWNHVAMTYQGSEIKIYVNGVLVTTKTGASGSPIDPVRWIGRVDNYFKGKIDEVRIWSTTRSETELKTYMCQKLTGSETGLEGYWKFNDNSGTTATDETSNNVDGTLTNMDSASDWVTSGAPIGDASSFLYTGSWSGEQLVLSSVNKGDIEINTISGTPDGVHIYRVDETPNSVSGISNSLGGNDIYYGVFLAGDASATYTTVYDYGLYAVAAAAEPNVEMYNRTDNTSTSWSLLSSTLNVSNNTLTETGNTGVNQEFLLGGTESSDVIGYLGPGGVGNTDGSTALELWLRGDSNVTSDGSDVVTAWLDESGNGNDVSLIGGDPTYTAAINGNGVISLDGNDYFQSAVTSNTGTTASAFFTGKITGYSATWAGILSGSKSGLLDWNTTDHVVFLNRNDGTDDIESHRNGVMSVVTNGLAGDDVKIMNSEYDGVENTIRLDGVAGTSVSSTESFDFDLIGIGKRITENKYTIGDYGEVIYFSKNINLAQKIIIENYLQAKFDGTLSSNDFYDEDNSANGDFDYDVAGIGQATDGSKHTDSQGTGIVRINNPRGLGNDEFLFWGRNNQLDIAFETDESVYLERLNTTFRASRRNNPGRIDVTFDLSGVDLSGLPSCENIELIIDDNSDFSSPWRTYSLTGIGAGLYRIENINIRNNYYFTLQYKEKIVVDATQFYNGTGFDNVPSESDDCYKLLVKNTATGSLPLSENAHVREVEVESGGKLVVNSGIRLQVTDGIENNGDIRMIGTSQLVQTHTGLGANSGVGSLYMDQQGTNASKYRYNYWSSPVSSGSGTYTVEAVMKDGTTVTSASSTPPSINFSSGYDGDHTTSPITVPNYWLYKFNNSWSHAGSSGTLNVGEGYTMKGPGAIQNYTFVGSPNDGEYSFAVSNGDVFLLGNPYPSALDADAFITYNSITNPNIDGSIYFWEHNGEVSAEGNEGHYKSNYQGGYAVRNIGGGVAAVAPSGIGGLGSSSGDVPGQYIAVGQGFFVNANESGVPGSATVVMNNSMRAFQVEDGSNSVFFKGKASKKSSEANILPSFRLGFEQTNDIGTPLTRQLLAVFKEGLSTEYDNGYDSGIYDIHSKDAYWKFSEPEETKGAYVIAGLDTYNVAVEIPLEVTMNAQGIVSFVELEKTGVSDRAYLYDKLLDIYYGLTNEVSIVLDAGTYSNRFYVTFKEDNSLSVGDVITSESVLIYQNSEGDLHIKTDNNLSISRLKLYNSVGELLLNYLPESIDTSDHVLPVGGVIPGVYIIQIETNKGIVSKKVLLE